MRIIAGSAGGRRLKAPPGSQTRPTSDRVREALFSILGEPPANSQVLDLFAGSGGLGLEALSRGALRAVFVEQNTQALRTLRENIVALGLEAHSSVHRGDAISNLRRLAREKASFHWIFVDPPYAGDLATQSLLAIGGCAILSQEGQVIVEHDRRNAPGDVYGDLVRTDTRRYGDTLVSFYERNSL